MRRPLVIIVAALFLLLLGGGAFVLTLENRPSSQLVEKVFPDERFPQ